MIDLFAGAGGLGLGAVKAGCDLRLCVDSDPWSCRTLAANEDKHGGRVLEEDVLRLTGEMLRDEAGLSDDDPLIVIGGAPCQPFSKAAYWLDPGDDAAYRRARAAGASVERPAPPTFVRPDARRSLVEEYWRLVVECSADAFVFENVRSITHPRHRPILDALVKAAEASGYRTALFIANAVEYGVPQRRQRVFLLGSREGDPVSPPPTHGDPAKGDHDLPSFKAAGPAIAPFAAERHFEPEEVVQGRWAAHLREIPPGWNYKHHTAWAGHPSPTWETETRFWNFLLKLSPSLPSWTISASPGPWVGPFHWESRRLRTPELAALQTFPAGYRFAGPRRERVRQIGNAVPVDLAASVIAQVAAALGAQSHELTAVT